MNNFDESKDKTTCIRPVNMTMSYEDIRGYIYYVYVCIHVFSYVSIIVAVGQL